MILESLHAGMPIAVETAGEEWRTALYKDLVSEPVLVGALGLKGDGQADLENHGGVDKAVSAYPSEHYEHWSSLLGLDCMPGAFGENFSTTSMFESEVCIGDIYRVGELVIEVSQPRQPCWKIARRWGVKKLALLVQDTGKTGWYYRVLREAKICAPAEMVLAQRPYPEWTIRRANDLMHRDKMDWAGAEAISRCLALSESWKQSFRGRARKREIRSDAPRLLGEGLD